MTKLYFAIWAGMVLRMSVAIWNGFFGPSYGADSDALGFHLQAAEYSRNLVFDQFVTGQIYAYILGLVYSVSTDSLFLGSFLSVLAWVVSAITLVAVMKMLFIEASNKFKAMLIYALLPSSILLTSVTLRESYQLLFVNLAIFSALKIYMHRSVRHWLLLITAVGGMGVLHGALLASGVSIIIGVAILLIFRTKNRIPFVRLALFIPVIAAFLYIVFPLFLNISYDLKDGLDVAVATYQLGTIEAGGRARYRSEVEIDGLLDLFFSVPVFLFQYLFEPLPWRVSSLEDIVHLIENCLRAWLIILVFFSFKNSSGQERRLLFFLFASYLLMEASWSLGTSNWGTAIRHHIPSMGLLVLSAFLKPRLLLNNRKVVRS